MAGARPILSLVSIILLAGGLLLQFFVILSGVISSTPINKVYFLQVATNGIKGPKHIPNPARWTFFALCGVVGGHNGNCGPVHPALPFDPPGMENFDTKNGLPDVFLKGNKYYYLSRFMFAFYLIAVFFAAIALFMSIFALCARLAAKLTGVTTGLALLFQTLAAALMTSWAVLGEHAFKKAGHSAKIGDYGFGFTWAAMFCFLIATILFCVGGSGDKSGTGNSSSSSKKGLFGRKKSTKERGSFVDSESGRRVKDEYE